MDLLGREKRFLSNLVCTLSLSEAWKEIHLAISNDVRNLNNFLNVDDDVFEQLLYEAVEKDCRRMWNVQRLYRGEALREPYLRQYHKKEHSSRLAHQIKLKITKSSMLYRKTKPAEKYHQLRQTLHDLLSHYVSLLTQSRNVDIYELIGASLVSSFRKHGSIPYLLRTPLLPQTSSFVTSTSKPATATAIKRILLSSMDGQADAIIRDWDYKVVEKFCCKFQGHLLPDTLRRPLWLTRLCKRHWDDLPLGAPLVEELSRLGVAKGMPSAPYIVPAALEDLVSRTIDYLMLKCFPKNASSASAVAPNREAEAELKKLHTKMSTSKLLADKHIKKTGNNSPSPTSNNKSFFRHIARPTSETNRVKTLKKRAQLLTSAIFVITGVISERTACIALFVMSLYPEESPVSESMLQLHNNISAKYLPSEQLHRAYSVALEAWSLLGREDDELRRHLEKGMARGNETAKRKHPQQPVCYTLLLPWLSSGFIGYVSEFVGIFIWDQLVMWGTRPEDFAQILPHICVLLLQMIRQQLLAANSREEMTTVISTALTTRRSKDFFVAFRNRLTKLRRRQDIMNEYLPFRNSCAILIQKFFRGMMGRKYVKALRQLLVQGTIDDYMDADGKVRAWLAETQHYQAIEAERRRRIQEELARHRGQENSRNIMTIFETWKQHTKQMQNLEERVVSDRRVKLLKGAWHSLTADTLHSKHLNELLAEYLAQKNKSFLPHQFKLWKSRTCCEIARKTLSRMLESIETDTKYDTILDNFEFENKEISEYDSDEEEANMYLDIKDARKSYHSSASSSPRLNEEEELAIMVDVMDVIDTMVDALCFEEENDRNDTAVITERGTEDTVSSPQPSPVDVPEPVDPVAVPETVEDMNIAASRRAEVALILSSLVALIENQQMKSQVSTTSLASTNTESTEERDHFDNTHIPELRKIMHTEMLKPIAMVAKGMPGQKRTLGTVRNMLKRASVLGQVTNALGTPVAPLGEENDDRFFSISDNFRRDIDVIEIDALQGFFMDQREVIGDLVEEKRIVKHFIQQWKENFAKTHKGQEPSAAHKKEIADAYKKYHELTQELKVKIQELRISEDELLIWWSRNKTDK